MITLCLLMLLISHTLNCTKTSDLTPSVNPARKDEIKEEIALSDIPDNTTIIYLPGTEAYMQGSQFKVDKIRSRRERSRALSASPRTPPKTPPRKATIMTVSAARYDPKFKQASTAPIRIGQDYFDDILNHFTLASLAIRPYEESFVHYDDDVVIDWNLPERQKKLVFSVRIPFEDFSMYVVSRTLYLITSTFETVWPESTAVDRPITPQKKLKVAHDFDGISFMYLPNEEDGEFEIVIFTRLEDPESASFKKFETFVEDVINQNLALEFKADLSFSVFRHRRGLIYRATRQALLDISKSNSWKKNPNFKHVMPLIGTKSWFKAVKDAPAEAKLESEMLRTRQEKLHHRRQARERSQSLAEEPRKMPQTTTIYNPLSRTFENFDFSGLSTLNANKPKVQNSLNPVRVMKRCVIPPKSDSIDSADAKPKSSFKTKTILPRSTSLNDLSPPVARRQTAQNITFKPVNISQPPRIQNPFPEDGPLPASVMHKIFPSFEEYLSCLDSISSSKGNDSPIKQAAREDVKDISPDSVADVKEAI